MEKRTITIKVPDMTEYKIETRNEDICKRYGYKDVKLKAFLLARSFVEHYINALDDEKPYAHIGCERKTNLGWNVHFSEKDENKETIIVEFLEFNNKESRNDGWGMERDAYSPQAKIRTTWIIPWILFLITEKYLSLQNQTKNKVIMVKVEKVGESILIITEHDSYLISKKEALQIASGITNLLIGEKELKAPPKKRKINSNALTQFELHTLKEHYSIELEKKLNAIGIKNTDWFPHIASTGGYVTFTTRSQRVIDKVNKALGTKFSFDFMNQGNIYYL